MVLLIALTLGMASVWAQTNNHPHAFSVSADQQVYFSPGNLQYQASTNTWKFAESQWGYLGEYNANISQTYCGWIDLFGWGTSGWNSGNSYYQPWSSAGFDPFGSQEYSGKLYGPPGQYNLTGNYANADWGVYNPIINGGNTANQWHTLTQPEWNFVFDTRTTTSGIRYAKANVNNVNGVILLPDDWSSSTYSLSNTNSGGASFSSNTLTASQWSTLEQAGAVFLPASGDRVGSSLYSVGSGGYYWSASCSSSSAAYVVYFGDSNLSTSGSYYRYSGQSVRLVRVAENCSFGINATPNPVEGGAVSGAGTYELGAVCTLTATPSAGYEYVIWTENGAFVSAEAAYSFVVVRERNLVANFVAEGNIVFADDHVKALCVANWDANGDGELSYVEAAVVTSLGEVFKNNTDIHSFEELSFFIGLESIGAQAFYGCTELTLITIPENVTGVGNQAFWNCPALQTVYFNAVNCFSMQSNNNYSVFSANTSGGASALTRVVLGSEVTHIPDYAFKGSQDIYQRLVIPASVEYIGKEAFSGCSGLALMTIQGNGLQTIGESAFYNCSSLRSDLVLPNSVTWVGNSAFSGCSLLSSVTLGTGLTSIGSYAFYNCNGITGELIIPDAITTIGDGAFSGCNGLTGALIISDAVTSIGVSAFSDCSSLSSVTLGTGLTSIGESVFSNCVGLTGALIIPNAVTSIGQYAFSGCSSLSSVTLGTGLTSIGLDAFGSCYGLTAVYYTGDIGQWCGISFSYSGEQFGANPLSTAHNLYINNDLVTDLSVPEGVTIIKPLTFCSAWCLTSLSIPNSVITISNYAFYGCSGLTGDLSFPSSVTTLGVGAFSYCHGFTGSLIFGKNVNSIGDEAFLWCNGFTMVISENPTPPTAGYYPFSGMNLSIPVYVPFNTVSTYQSTAGWSQFNNYKEQCVFDAIGMDTEKWSDVSNWYGAELPNEDDVVCVNSNCHLDVDANVLHLYVFNLNDALTIDSGATLTVSNGIGTMRPSQLIIAEGGQLVNPSGPVNGTLQKHINGYGTGDEGWYSVASPILGGPEVNAFTADNYDLFAYEEPTHYWRNQKVADNNIITLNLGQGYLYAHQTDTTLSFAGKLNMSNAEISVPVTYEGTPLEGYTLLGNPYTNDLSIGDVQLNGTPLTIYYKINGGGSFVAYTDAEPIHPGEGFLVMAPEGGTITFAPLSGQGRNGNVSELRDGNDPVGFRLPDHADLIDVDAYNGELQYVSVTAVANATEYGTVLGGGNYAVGSTCTLTAVPNEIYSFVNWTCNGLPVSTEPSYSFTVMGPVSYTANFVQTIFTQTATLNAGWNWMSTYIDQSDIDGLTMLENALGDNGLRIVSHHNGYVEPLEVAGVTYWYGTLSEITNEQMYKVMTSAACDAPIMGPIASPSAYPITINSGWNWIGYPSNQSASLNEAMAGFEAEDDDIIKSRNNGYATYFGGTWVGTLNSLVPGSGYMYQSHSGTAKTLVFQQGRGQAAVNEQFDCTGSLSGNYNDNMTVTAVVELNGEELRSSEYELVAMVGDECRGSVRLMYVEPIDRYVAFLTVLGETSESLSFALVDGEDLLLSDFTTSFEADAALGTLGNPLKLNFGTMAVEENDQVKTAVFPNPVKDVLVVEGTGMKRIEVFNVMGQKVNSAAVDGASVRIDMSGCTNGIYLVRIMTENGMATHHIVKE